MQIIDWRSVESMSEDHELEKFESWAKDKYDTKQRELRILEIGSFKGKTTAILAQFGIVYAVDLWGNVDQGDKCYNDIGQHHYISFIQNMIRLKLIDRVFPITSTSVFLDTLPNLELDVIFIDAGHFYEDVKKDIGMSFKHLVDDGIMIFHDYKRPGFGYPPYDPNHPHHGPHDPWWGVVKAVDEFISLGEFEIQEHYAGIVCLRKK
jgi:SAM-dependent methyltransferase